MDTCSTAEMKPAATRPPTVVSAPGKVLLAGGYLVLDREQRGLVVATDSRFYAVAKDSRTSSGYRSCTVTAPQFDDGKWEYRVVHTQEGGWDLICAKEQPVNPYVEAVLRNIIFIGPAAAKKRSTACYKTNSSAEDSPWAWWGDQHHVEVNIVGDNDFYSQRAQLDKQNEKPTTAALLSLPKFNICHCPISKVHKTGLGSSAAMTTALTGCLLLHFGVIEAEDLMSNSMSNQGKRLLHATAQLSHCYAQGKIGSGFDVAAAVFGSQIYRRFTPSILEKAMAAAETKTTTSRNLLSTLLSPDWDSEHIPFSLPPGLALALADVDAGSATPGMVRKVLQWRSAGGKGANNLWKSLGEFNYQNAKALSNLAMLATQHPMTYRKFVCRFADMRAETWESLHSSMEDPVLERPIIDAFVTAFNGLLKTRETLQSLTNASQVPVEPQSQTNLLDACASMPGVLGVGVPGAGGYDAIFCIHIDTSSVRKALENLFCDWKDSRVTPLLAREGTSGVLLHQFLEDYSNDPLGKNIQRVCRRNSRTML